MRKLCRVDIERNGEIPRKIDDYVSVVALCFAQILHVPSMLTMKEKGVGELFPSPLKLSSSFTNAEW